MSKPSVRQNILLRSVQRLLDEGEQVHRVVLLSTRHRWFAPYAIASGVGLFVVASVTGIDSLLNRMVLAVCGIAIAGMATTNYSILAETTTGLVLCRSSRVRQYAKEVVNRLPVGTSLTMVGSTVITSDWKIDDVIYTLTKRWEATMRQLSIEWA
jgi:hypothetical protein